MNTTYYIYILIVCKINSKYKQRARVALVFELRYNLTNRQIKTIIWSFKEVNHIN